MAITKEQFYISIVFLIAVFSVLIMNFGNDLVSNDDISLNNKSLDYISDYGGYVSGSGIEGLTEEDIGDLEQESLLESGNESGQQSVTDILASLNYYKDRMQKISSYIKLVYNFPTFILLSLGLPILAFSDVINILGVTLFIGLIILLVKLVRGS